MATIINSIGLKGIEGYLVQVEVQMVMGSQGISIVGLPDATVKESKERILGALTSSGCMLLKNKIIINLSPADQRKKSPIFDLAIAIGVMKEIHYYRDKIPEHTAFLGSLSLDGSVKSVNGLLPAVIAARNAGIKTLYLPSAAELPFTKLEGLELRFVNHIRDVLLSLSGKILPSIPQAASLWSNEESYTFDKDFSTVRGHRYAKWVLELAAAGSHNVLMYGAPGSGKSMLAETFPSILPPLSEYARYEVMSLYQLANVSVTSYAKPPFRSPHHSSSAVSLVGGGSNPLPGEVSLAHRGVLFLDEIAEFPKRTLDMLRQPLENGKVTISRASSTVTYPTRFLLLAAMNLCPCGYLGSPYAYCTCTPRQIRAYQNRISGAILDRFDFLLHVRTVSLVDEIGRQEETSASIRTRVMRARERQYERYQAEVCNGTVANELFFEKNSLNKSQSLLLQQYASKENCSSRVQMKMIRLARTLSDLQGEKNITDEALWKALKMKRHFNSEKQSIKQA
ncbi:YifB family Mg chelatase-like AAA ATPase [Heyndrickxia acidiproducens]|uniref:YifB family Mg chelatase-like AAA ATPase n=1 Tax=Heyndrickxia acidiproducens TaxID=1121084 RepID=UPI0003673FEF|nr:YifB family Mg chelatase-like AAA ATPase [Heyndrickxia acidiproducens]